MERDIETQLLEALELRMAGKTQLQFARELGMTDAQLSRIRNRVQGMGRESARRVVACYPELESLVIRYLLRETDKEDAA